jgi:hypothetical protein
VHRKVQVVPEARLVAAMPYVRAHSEDPPLGLSVSTMFEGPASTSVEGSWRVRMGCRR